MNLQFGAFLTGYFLSSDLDLRCCSAATMCSEGKWIGNLIERRREKAGARRRFAE
jgi:hypothetical protein